jgi:hypothetical protein
VTEVSGEGLSEGTQVVIGEGAGQSSAAGNTERNPFAPQIFRGPQGPQGQPQQGTEATRPPAGAGP